MSARPQKPAAIHSRTAIIKTTGFIIRPSYRMRLCVLSVRLSVYFSLRARNSKTKRHKNTPVVIGVLIFSSKSRAAVGMGIPMGSVGILWEFLNRSEIKHKRTIVFREPKAGGRCVAVAAAR